MGYAKGARQVVNTVPEFENVTAILTGLRGITSFLRIVKYHEFTASLK